MSTTSRTTEDLIKIMRSCKGRIVQRRHLMENVWVDDLNPKWNWVHCDYRPKPNPFVISPCKCGSHSIRVDTGEGGHCIECCDCSRWVDSPDSLREAAEVWNARPVIHPWSFETRPKDVTWVYKKGFITDRLITAWKDDCVELGCYASPTYDELLRDWIQRDGSPCGTEVVP